MQLVTFRLAGELYGLDVFRVREVLRVGTITALPQAPGYVCGVVELRGRVMPALDLRLRLGLVPVDLTRHSRIVVVESGGRLLGLLVDEVRHVVAVPTRAIDETPPEAETSSDFIKGIGRLEDGLIVLLDLDGALQIDFELAPMED